VRVPKRGQLASAIVSQNGCLAALIAFSAHLVKKEKHVGVDFCAFQSVVCLASIALHTLSCVAYGAVLRHDAYRGAEIVSSVQIPINFVRHEEACDHFVGTRLREMRCHVIPEERCEAHLGIRLEQLRRIEQVSYSVVFLGVVSHTKLAIFKVPTKHYWTAAEVPRTRYGLKCTA